jgi:protein N-terminal glutamine amidohydrolase
VKTHYTPFYCEENIWHLCRQEDLKSPQNKVVFISNENRACALWFQRAVKAGEPVIWDYHVILIARDGDCWQVWDLDTLLGCPLNVEAYLHDTFHTNTPLPYQARFRIMQADDFVNEFSSDRSHMRDLKGKWLKPPPAWQPIYNGESSNLMDLVDFSNDRPGYIVDLQQFRNEFATSPK